MRKRLISVLMLFVFVLMIFLSENTITVFAEDNCLLNWLVPWESGIWMKGTTYSGHSTQGGVAYDFASGGTVALYAPTNGTIKGLVVNYPGNTYPNGSRSYGNYIKIATDDGYTVWMAHMQSVNSSLAVNQRILKGTFVGNMGNTGYSSGQHLHFEVYPATSGLFGLTSSYILNNYINGGGAGGHIPAKPTNVTLRCDKSIVNTNEETCFYFGSTGATKTYLCVETSDGVRIDTYNVSNTSNKTLTFSEVGEYIVYFLAYNGDSEESREGAKVSISVVDKLITYTETTVSKTASGYSTNINLYNIPESSKIIVIGYKDKKFVTMQTIDYTKDTEMADLTGDIDTVKVMVWSSLSALKPLTGVEEIPSSMWITE